MTFYAELAADTQELLAEFGQAVVLRKVAAGAYDPATGTVTQTETNHNTVAALFDFTGVQSGQMFAPETAILAGDKQCLMSPQVTAVPAPNDKVVDAGGTVWQVAGMKEVNPAGTVVLYELLLRR